MRPKYDGPKVRSSVVVGRNGAISVLKIWCPREDSNLHTVAGTRP